MTIPPGGEIGLLREGERNPKPEIRRPKQIRNPKAKGRKLRFEQERSSVGAATTELWRHCSTICRRTRFCCYVSRRCWPNGRRSMPGRCLKTIRSSSPGKNFSSKRGKGHIGAARGSRGRMEWTASYGVGTTGSESLGCRKGTVPRPPESSRSPALEERDRERGERSPKAEKQRRKFAVSNPIFPQRGTRNPHLDPRPSPHYISQVLMLTGHWRNGCLSRKWRRRRGVSSFPNSIAGRGRVTRCMSSATMTVSASVSREIWQEYGLEVQSSKSKVQGPEPRSPSPQPESQSPQSTVKAGSQAEAEQRCRRSAAGEETRLGAESEPDAASTVDFGLWTLDSPRDFGPWVPLRRRQSGGGHGCGDFWPIQSAAAAPAQVASCAGHAFGARH